MLNILYPIIFQILIILNSVIYVNFSKRTYFDFSCYFLPTKIFCVKNYCGSFPFLFVLSIECKLPLCFYFYSTTESAIHGYQRMVNIPKYRMCMFTFTLEVLVRIVSKVLCFWILFPRLCTKYIQHRALETMINPFLLKDQNKKDSNLMRLFVIEAFDVVVCSFIAVFRPTIKYSLV